MIEPIRPDLEFAYEPMKFPYQTRSKFIAGWEREVALEVGPGWWNIYWDLGEALPAAPRPDVERVP